MPVVSVILPAYQSERFLRRSAGSVLAQTLSDLELIIVDDHSTDGTRQIIRELEKKDSRVKAVFIEVNSGGAARPKNAAFPLARGRYIAYIDHDDEWLPEKLALQIKLLETVGEKDVGMVSCNAFMVNECGGQALPPTVAKPNFGGGRAYVETLGIVPSAPPFFKKLRYISALEVFVDPFGYASNNSGMVFPRAALERLGNRNEGTGMFEDVDMVLRVAEAGLEFYFVDKPLYNVYAHGKNFTKPYHLLSDADALRRAESFLVLLKSHPRYKELPRLYSERLRGVGMLFMAGGDSMKARKYFIQAMQTHVWHCKNYINFFLSFFGSRLYRKILSFL